MSLRLLAAAGLVAVLLPASAKAAEPTPLVDATARGDLSTVRTLIGKKIDVNAARIDGTTALHVAVNADRLDIVDALLRAGAKAAAADRYGVTPLYLASLNGNADMIRRHVPDPASAIYYLSGPASMVRAMRELLVQMDIDEENIRTEEFDGY